MCREIMKYHCLSSHVEREVSIANFESFSGDDFDWLRVTLWPIMLHCDQRVFINKSGYEPRKESKGVCNGHFNQLISNHSKEI